jgi:hypothetical protein
LVLALVRPNSSQKKSRRRITGVKGHSEIHGTRKNRAVVKREAPRAEYEGRREAYGTYGGGGAALFSLDLFLRLFSFLILFLYFSRVLFLMLFRYILPLGLQREEKEKKTPPVFHARVWWSVTRDSTPAKLPDLSTV